MAHTLGDVVTVPITFRTTATNALVNPTAWQVEVQPPGGQLKFTLLFGVAVELTQLASPAVGAFQYRQATDRADPDDVGRWQYWVTATGTGQSSRPGFFNVDKAPIA